MPDALGEDLLVIQKEFDGFADTRERLDLLALDKEDRLVVVENKLDDTGRDVAWQALKYVAYCSSLKKAQIVDIYQKYLDRWQNGEKAETNLCEFLEVDELDEIALNPGNKQRLMLVAAKFRKEVTSTVLWLIGHGVRAQCFQAVPHSVGEELLIDLRQIIPTPEAADYMIGIADKQSDEESFQSTQKHRRKLRRAFWTETLEELRTRRVARYENISPGKEQWLAAGAGVSGCTYNLLFLKKSLRVELCIDKPQRDQNKEIFDKLRQNKQEIDEHFGATLEWLRKDEQKCSRICYSKSFDGYDNKNWPKMIEWLCEHVVRLENAFSEPLDRLNRELKARKDT